MQLGVAFPTTEIGTDPAAIRDFAQAVEGLGYAHLTCIDHVVQSGKPNPGWQSYYVIDNMFHEVLVLFGFIAACTQRLELVPAILILPQRQTALVAKQAAEIDVLSGGRLRLGVGIGWNAIEYEALGEDFHTRGRRMEEQIVVLRALWTQRTVSVEGRDHRLNAVGLNPPPVQRPIPIWVGAMQARAIERAGRVADGWLLNPRVGPGNEIAHMIETFRQAARGAGRDAAALGMDATVFVAGKSPEQCAEEAEAWRRLGATHLTVRTMTAGFTTPDQHIAAIRAVKAALG